MVINMKNGTENSNSNSGRGLQGRDWLNKNVRKLLSHSNLPNLSKGWKKKRKKLTPIINHERDELHELSKEFCFFL